MISGCGIIFERQLVRTYSDQPDDNLIAISSYPDLAL